MNKHNLTGDVNSERGNCATFLMKVEGVLDGLFQDMMSTGSTESKVSHMYQANISDYQGRILVYE